MTFLTRYCCFIHKLCVSCKLIQKKNMKEILTHNFTATYFVIGLFTSLFLYNVVNIGYWIKRLFKMRITKEVKLLDCMPCFSFWVTLVITQSILCSMLVWSIVFLNDKTK